MLVTMLMINKPLGLQNHNTKIAPTNIDDYTKNKLLNMQQENFIPQINIGINDKRTDEIYQKNMNDYKQSDERYQISKNKEERIIEDMETMKKESLKI